MSSADGIMPREVNVGYVVDRRTGGLHNVLEVCEKTRGVRYVMAQDAETAKERDQYKLRAHLQEERISELEEWNAAYTSRETAYTNRISELEATMDAVLKLIAGAPHEQGCASLSWDLYKRGQCTCWKSKIGSK